MRSCDLCNEPATHNCLMVKSDGESRQYYCYVHAVEANLFETPLDLLGSVATRSGYPIHAVIFVLEALVRGKLIEDSDPDHDSAVISSSLTAQDICFAVLHSAAERFGDDARFILERWCITRCCDIGNILVSLIESGILKVSQNALPEGLHNLLTAGVNPLF